MSIFCFVLHVVSCVMCGIIVLCCRGMLFLNAVGSDSHWPGWADHRRLSEAGVRRSSGDLFF